MEHGRGHDERHYKTTHPRHNNTPSDDDDTELEATLSFNHRHGAFVRSGRIGPYRGRIAGTSDADYAPTPLGVEEERARHEKERSAGEEITK
jgi:hypothetical protein